MSARAHLSACQGHRRNNSACPCERVFSTWVCARQRVLDARVCSRDVHTSGFKRRIEESVVIAWHAPVSMCSTLRCACSLDVHTSICNIVLFG